MKTSAGLFLSSTIFAALIAAAYWIVARDPTGTFLLGMMACGFGWLLGYTRMAERSAGLLGDRDFITMSEAAGERLGIFVTRSPWPIALAASIAVALVGLVSAPALSIVAAVAFGAIAWRMIGESA